MAAEQTDFNGALGFLVVRLGQRVHVVVRTLAQEGSPADRSVDGTLTSTSPQEALTGSEGAGAATFSFEANDFTFVLDPATFQSARMTDSVLSVEFDTGQIEVTDQPADELSVAADQSADGPPADAAPPVDESSSPEQVESPAAVDEGKPTEEPTRQDGRFRRLWRWVNLPLPSSIAGSLLTALIVVVIGAFAGLFDDPDLWPAPNRPTKVEPYGDVSGPTHVRIVKQKDVINSYVVEDRIAHHMQTSDIYHCNAGHYPGHWNVDPRDEWEKLVDPDKDGENQGCPAGEQPVLSPEVIKRNYILRDSKGSSWLIIDERRVPIPDGRDDPPGPLFTCLTKRYLVWDFVDPEEIDSFREHPTITRASC